MRARILLPAAVAVLLPLGACDKLATSESDGTLTGTWRYRATGFKKDAPNPNLQCDMETILVIRQEEGGHIEGVSQEAVATCYGEGIHRQSDAEPTGVVRGEVAGSQVHFSNAGNWHSFGELRDGRVEGYLESYGGTEADPDITLRSGSFTLERISDQGYEGPAA